MAPHMGAQQQGSLQHKRKLCLLVLQTFAVKHSFPNSQLASPALAQSLDTARPHTEHRLAAQYHVYMCGVWYQCRLYCTHAEPVHSPSPAVWHNVVSREKDKSNFYVSYGIVKREQLTLNWEVKGSQGKKLSVPKGLRDQLHKWGKW